VIDPLQKLTHDHRELTSLLVAVHSALARVERGQSKVEDEMHEILDGIEAFREALLEHFASEQEALLPFVASRVPSMSARSEEVLSDHDRIAAVLTALVKDLARAEVDVNLTAWRRELGRFEELYGAHTRTELAFLNDLARSLADDPEALRELRTLLAHS
jgi:hemerythrin-like domain-containing protein